MERPCNGEGSESESAAVFPLTGEPAICINGLPNVVPGGIVPFQLDGTSDAGLKGDPCFGEWLEGRKVRKMFGDQYYSGKVVKFDEETTWYRVVYEDGDFEDLEWYELDEVLLPLDISISLETLVSQICKCDKSAMISGKSITKSLMHHGRNIEGSEKFNLLQTTQVSKSESGKQMAANELRRRTPKETLKGQRGIQTKKRDVEVQRSGDDYETARSYADNWFGNKEQ